MSTKKTTQENNSKAPLREQLAELENLISWFDQSEFDLDEALEKFDEAVKKAAVVRKGLSEVEQKVMVLKQRFDQAQDLGGIS